MLPFKYSNSNYAVIGLHDYAISSTKAVYNIEVDASYTKTNNNFALTSNIGGGVTAGFICIGLVL